MDSSQSEMLGNLLAIVLVTGLFAYLITSALNKEEPSLKKECKPHKWSINHKDDLQCTSCGFVAGSHQTKGGDYESGEGK